MKNTHHWLIHLYEEVEDEYRHLCSNLKMQFVATNLESLSFHCHLSSCHYKQVLNTCVNCWLYQHDFNYAIFNKEDVVIHRNMSFLTCQKHEST